MLKTKKIFVNMIPVLLMIGLIPYVQSDYLLALLYSGIIILSLIVRYTKHDAITFCIGVVFMTLSECLFISTGVETFVRNSLFGLMPVWLPLLWGYGFIVIKRSLGDLNLV